MAAKVLHHSKFLAVSFLGAIVTAVLLYGCVTKAPAKRPETLAAVAPRPAVSTAAFGLPCRASTALPNPGAPQINCAAPPETFDVSSFFSGSPSPQTMAQAGPTFDAWAWESFAAYNWPAQPGQGTNYPTGFVRGVPNLNASFVGAQPTDTLVWETFKEKREVFNNVVTASGWQQITYPPDQSISIEGGPVQPCTPADQIAAAKLPGGAHRRVLQASKLAPALGVGPNSLDETAEVASPAQESQAAMCAGYSGSALTTCQGLFPPPPGGTATSVYPPNIVNTRPALGVGPRVFDPTGNLVFYEVRVNYDYFSYVLANGLNLSNPVNPPPPPPPTVKPPYQPPWSLPWRTSAMAQPGTAQQRMSTVAYNAMNTVTAYGTMPSTPPTVGSVQVKSAWKRLGAGDNPSQYHTTQAVYFNSSTTQPGGVCYRVGNFGLIALHIIQRVHMGPRTAANADPVGGTFIFATWEHNSIGNGGGYKYLSFLANGEADQTNPTPYPTVANAIPVNRQQSYPLATTAKVTKAVNNELPTTSVWNNYRLIGTQFYAKVNPTTSLQYNQPYFLANLVVETNNGLQNFQGLPPNIAAVSQYNGFTASTVPPQTTSGYYPAFNNVSFNGSAQNMGGCMGCHGVAQILGSNFSFVLLDGQKGAGIDTPTVVSIPP
jgi:hypothetical protein